MYVGFSTLGCPGLPIERVIALAIAAGSDMVQLRIAPDEPIDINLDVSQRETIRSMFIDNRIIVDSLATYIRLDSPDAVDDTRRHVDLAVDLGAHRIRIFPGKATVDEAAKTLANAYAATAGSGVTLAVETHDDHLRAADVADIIGRSGVNALAVWDILHTHNAGETPEVSAGTLSGRLGELQIKDVDQSGRPVAPGTGVLPVAHAIRAARDSGFDGAVIFEHEMKWRPDAAPFAPALAMALRLVRSNW